MKPLVNLSRPWTDEDIDLIERALCVRARDDFYEFRKLTMPGMIQGWWQKEVADHLQNFYCDWQEGLRPVLVLQAPPQHGKSSQIIDFVAWASGHNPDLKSIYASYSEDLGVIANVKLQRLIDSKIYQKIFADTGLSATNVVTLSRKPMRNSYALEFTGHGGSFRNTTVRGQITGLGLDLGLVDDPIKGREEASSLTIRDKTWAWFTDDFFSRFAETAGLIMLMTRWHVDDPVGRFIERFPNAKVLSYPALAIEDEKHRKQGEPLFPEHKSKEFLLERKRALTIGSWMSLYQQSPIVVGGDLFPIEKIKIVGVMPDDMQIKRSVRYWDKAGTQGGGAYTAGVLMHELIDKRFVIEQVIRGQWSALEREQRIRQTCELDNQERRIETYVEQEPGSGGKESAEGTIANLRGYRVYADRVTGKKEIRAEPYAAQVQAGNISIVAAAWNKSFLDEHELFPNGKYKDQVDAAAAAFLKLTVRKSSYDSTYSWVKENA